MRTTPLDVVGLSREAQVQLELEDVLLVGTDPVDHGVAAQIEQVTPKQNNDFGSWLQIFIGLTESLGTVLVVRSWSKFASDVQLSTCSKTHHDVKNETL